MKIALCCTFNPFDYSEVRTTIEWLKILLEASEHHVEVLYIPDGDGYEAVFQQMAAFRWMDLSVADRIICFGAQAQVISHPHKIIWVIDHLREEVILSNAQGRAANSETMSAFNDALQAVEGKALNEAKKVFANSDLVSEQLKELYGIDCEVLCPPPSLEMSIKLNECASEHKIAWSHIVARLVS